MAVLIIIQIDDNVDNCELVVREPILTNTLSVQIKLDTFIMSAITVLSNKIMVLFDIES